MGLTSVTSITRVIQIGLTKINRPKINQNSTKEGNTQSSSLSQGNKGPPSAKPVKSGDGFKTSLTCDYCKLSGHNKTKCWKLMGKHLAAQQ